jgi:hypothetical protein
LDNILKSYIGYHDLECLSNSPNYFKLQKYIFAMIQQLGFLTSFITFNFAKTLWDHFIKALHTFHARKLNIPNKLKNLQSIHIVGLLWIDHVICARYYEHKTYSTNLYQRIISFWIHFFSLSQDSKIMIVNITMGFYGLKMHLCMESKQVKKLNNL